MAIHQLGAYPFSFPDLVSVVSVDEDPQMHRVNAIIGTGAVFDVTIVPRCGTESEREKLVAEMLDFLPFTRHVSEPYVHHGNLFTRHELDLEINGQPMTAEHFIGFAFGDLLHFSITYQRDIPNPESIRLLALSTVCSAIVLHGPSAPITPKSWWKRFRRE